jgi:hypothetical protein
MTERKLKRDKELFQSLLFWVNAPLRGLLADGFPCSPDQRAEARRHGVIKEFLVVVLNEIVPINLAHFRRQSPNPTRQSDLGRPVVNPRPVSATPRSASINVLSGFCQQQSVIKQ